MTYPIKKEVSVRLMFLIIVITLLFIEAMPGWVLSFQPVTQLPKKPGESWLQLGEGLRSDGYQARGR